MSAPSPPMKCPVASITGLLRAEPWTMRPSTSTLSAWKIMPVPGPATRSSRGLAQRDGDALRLRRQAEQAEPRLRPIGDEDRLLARIRQRDRAGDLAVEQRRPIKLRPRK